MTATEARSLIAGLKAAYPRQEISVETLKVYTRHLVKLDYRLAGLACEQHTGESPYFPSVAELLSRSKAIARSEQQPKHDDDDLVRLSPEQLAELKAWAKGIGGRMDDLPEPEPMPGEEWFAEHEEELRQLAPAAPKPRERDSA